MRLNLSFDDLLSVIGEAETEGDWRGPVEGIADLKEARGGDLSFLGNSRYTHEVATSRASAILLPRDYKGAPKADQVFLRVENPSLALGRVCALLQSRFWPRPPSGIHPTAVIDRDAQVDETASVGPYCLVSSGARIGARSVLTSHVSLGARAAIGPDSRILTHVTIGDFCTIGARVFLNPGAVIGSDGFGYETVERTHQKIPQIGRVVIGDDVEIGANVTIDRARFSETRIGEGTKIDNLVQIGHNVRIGRHCLIVAQVGISGSTTVGDHVMIGGQTGVVGHVTIGDGARIGAQSGISKSVPPGQTVQGAPATDIRLFQRINALQRRLPEFFERFREWESAMQEPKGVGR